MNTIQALDSKPQIYNKHTTTLINAYIAKHQKQQERDSKSVRLQNNHSKMNKQPGKQINKACRWARKQERMYGTKTRIIPLTLCSSIDSIHWSLCSGSSARRYHRLSFTLMSKRHSSNSWGCTEGGRTRIRALLDTAPEHKPFLWGKQMKTLAPDGCEWNLSYLLSQHFPPGPDWASLFIIPLSLRLFFCLLHFYPTQVDLNEDNKLFLFPPRSEFRGEKRQHKCLEKKSQTVNVKCWAMSLDKPALPET